MGAGRHKRRVAKKGSSGISWTMSAALIPPAPVERIADEPRPPLILVAVDMARHGGTEPGKAWAWACALARRYTLHIVTAPAVAERCRGEDVAAEWHWHVTRVAQPHAVGLSYYRAYARWCRDVPRVVKEIVATARPVGLHHIVLGSFRVLPRYDRCGVLYSLGPLGGGEATPRELLATARLAWYSWIYEWARPWLSDASAGVPALRAVMRGSQLALGTSRETERVLQRMGARRTGVDFPDCLPADVNPSVAQPVAMRAAELGQRVRLIWSGRAVWWKAGQLAVEFLRRLTAAGVDAELQMFSYGHALDAWRRLIAAAGLASRVRISGFVPRTELLAAFGRAHLFVYPTLHDSAATALLEAYAMGLPSLTVGLGGPAVVATPQTGYNVRPTDLNTWLDGAVKRVRLWQREPATWVAASEAASTRAREFGTNHMDAMVDRWLPPAVFTR